MKTQSLWPVAGALAAAITLAAVVVLVGVFALPCVILWAIVDTLRQ